MREEQAAKTTPGPWQQGDRAMGNPARRDWYAVQHVFGHEPFEGILESEWGVYPPPGEAGPVCIAAGEANARLIAEAPAFLAWAQKHAFNTHRGTLMLDIVDVIELQNIIARATGEAP